jgi:signal transduction histidine kinase
LSPPFAGTTVRSVPFDNAPETVAALERELETLAGERRAMFARLAELESERANHAFELFVMAAHEIGTPLSKMVLTNELILGRVRGTADELPREWLVKQLETQEAVVRRMQAMMQLWLVVPQLRAGTLPTVFEAFDLSELVADAVERHREELAWAGCPVELALEPLPGRWDRVRVDAVLTHLVSNALKFGAGGPIEVTASGDEERATIRVRDHGIGIAPSEQAHIFERFARVSSAARVPGVGVGLWMSRALLRALGGTIRVDSVPASGATFTVTLPRARGE